MHRILVLLTLMILTGCNTSDERVTRLVEQQARQNEALAEQHQQITSATHELITADKQSREDFSSLTEQLQEERVSINQGRDALEEERRAIAAQRQREPVIATAITYAAMLVACVLPLVVCVYVLRATASEGDDPHLMNEALVEQLFCDHPLPGSGNLRRLEERSVPEPTV